MARFRLIRRILSPLYHYFVPNEGAPFGPIDDELVQHKDILKGRVLNAGAGWRSIIHLVTGELINQDIEWPDDKRTNIHIRSPLHEIPTASDWFDAIVCIAVIEHVENPEEVIPEMYRVLKPGGHLILTVPFLQPEHKIPTDFQRYTRDGLIRLVQHHGFRVVKAEGLFTVYHTLYWQVWVWLHLKNSIVFILLRLVFLRPLLWAARHSKLSSDKLASCFQVVATKDRCPAKQDLFSL